MTGLTGVIVWITLVVVCAICMKWGTDTSSQKKEKVLVSIGLVAGLAALWMAIVAVLDDTRSILAGIFWLVVGLVGTLYLVYPVYGMISNTTTAKTQGK